MSRIGNAPIPVPGGVKINQENNKFTVTGPKGTLSRELPGVMLIEQEENILRVKRPSDERSHRSLHGLTRTLLANMLEGVTQGFTTNLELYGVGYRAQLQGSKLSLQLGFSHPVEMEAPPGIAFGVETFVPTGENKYLSARISVTGIDKEVVGQTAANLRAFKKPEPYKGKGIRYKGEKVRRKAGKAAKAQR
jgi:large subunit ribosomal protein L6